MPSATLLDRDAKKEAALLGARLLVVRCPRRKEPMVWASL
jgi:hypothetical protein